MGPPSEATPSVYSPLQIEHHNTTTRSKRGSDRGVSHLQMDPNRLPIAYLDCQASQRRTANGSSVTTNVADANPKIVKRLHRLAEEARADLGDSLTKRQGPGIRKAGQLGPGDKRLGF